MAERGKRRTPQWRKAEMEAGFVAVVVVGWSERRPLYFGDNMGAWPVTVGVTKDPKAYVASLDRHPLEVVPHAYVWTTGKGWADRLKAALEAAIAASGGRLPNGWFDLEPAIAAEALVAVAAAARIEVFDGPEKERRIAAIVERRRKAFKRGW
jgi:hypothetical protein